MSQYGGFNNFGGGQNGGGGSINPNDLAMSGSYGFGNTNGYGGGSAMVDDDDLLASLNGSAQPSRNGMNHQVQDFESMGDMGIFTPDFGHAPQHIDQSHINGYSNTPEGDPIQSPFAHSYNQPQFRQMQQPFGTSLQSPISYSGSPLPGNDLANDGEHNYLNAKPRARLSQAQAQAMQRKTSITRSPLTPQTAMANLTVGSHESPAGFGAQPIRTPNSHHEKSPSGQWMHTPNSLQSYPGNGFSSPMQHAAPSSHSIQHPQLTDVMRQAGTSMPAKLGAPVSTQEAKRKRRRESHNLVERRRRDNINERIQDLSKLVPPHRLEDEKIRKLLSNGTPLSPSLTGVSQPGQATSGLAGPGAKRATGVGSITTGLPLEDKDKGPNKGDILNGAVSWTRDLMWMLSLKLQQQEEVANYLAEQGLSYPLELTDDEKRMQSELMEAMSKNDAQTFSYTRYNGSGLRVPQHTDYKGVSLDDSAVDAISVSPENHGNGDLMGDLGNGNEFWHDPDDDVKEEDEFSMVIE